MRKSRAETAETRRRIVEVAAQTFRANGIHATGLADLMAEAGLSHGGFYRHFDSKDQLVAEACEAGLTAIAGRLEEIADAGAPKNGFGAMVDAYLSEEHRDGPASGCPLAGMGSELARADDETRAAASRGVEDLVQILEKRVGHRGHEASHSKAVFALAAMVGAVTLSRIILDPETSRSVLQDVKQHLNAI